MNIQLLLKCPYCPGFFAAKDIADYRMTKQYRLPGYVHCPHCKIRIMRGRALEVVPTCTEMQKELQSVYSELEDLYPYNFSKMTLKIWQLGNEWHAQWLVDPRDELKYNLRSSKNFGGRDRTEQGVIQEAQWWMEQRQKEKRRKQ